MWLYFNKLHQICLVLEGVYSLANNTSLSTLAITQQVHLIDDLLEEVLANAMLFDYIITPSLLSESHSAIPGESKTLLVL